jgi:hypothetical protein
LALFGRRPPQRVDRPSLRRSKTYTKPAPRTAKKIWRRSPQARKSGYFKGPSRLD